MKCLIAALLVTAVGCAKTMTGDIYECPKTLLESVNAKLEQLCPIQPSSLPPQ